MADPYRWDPCIAHRGHEVVEFVADYFSCVCRRVLLVAGAGFDPRSRAVTTLLGAAVSPVRALFIQENRPNPIEAQVDRAGANKAALLAAVTNHDVIPVEIFGSDGAVVGGRNAIAALSRQDVMPTTDIVVDVSALSAGTSFPIIRYFVELINRGKGPSNLHVFVAHDPRLDADIRSIPSDVPGYVHGFRGGSTLFDASSAARLWLPQLATGRRGALGRLYDFVEPHDTCPILPFPASDPRLGDALAAEYLTELETTWLVDTRNVVYADEGDPVDLYRTILRLDDLRQPVFAETGGSMLVLSPLGSKVMALGALMAALERDLPVAHLEPIGYELAETVPDQVPGPNLVHIWLEGDVYPQPRPALPAERRAAP
jgi:hypothetical protein